MAAVREQCTYGEQVAELDLGTANASGAVELVCETRNGTILKLLRKIDMPTQRNIETAAEHDQRMADPVPLDDLVKRLRGQ